MSNSSKTLYEGVALSLKLEQATYPDGASGILEIVRHPGGAATVALNEKHEICLIRQYRFAAGGWLWEIPAGRIEHKEDPLETAKRELREEAGVTANEWKPIGAIYPSPGICDERIFLYMASDLSRHSIEHEKDEYIEIYWVPFDEAIGWIQQGKIVDAKSIISLLYVKSYI